MDLEFSYGPQHWQLARSKARLLFDVSGFVGRCGANCLARGRHTHDLRFVTPDAPAVAFEQRGLTEEKITEQEWEYNTLSLPETHTQQGWTSEDDRLGPSGGYTTEAEYDALGLTVANEYSNNRRLEHNYDGLNRLQVQETVDDTNFGTVASYLYSGRPPFPITNRNDSLKRPARNQPIEPSTTQPPPAPRP